MAAALLLLLSGRAAPAGADDATCQREVGTISLMLQEVESLFQQGQPAKAVSRALEALQKTDREFEICPGTREFCRLGVIGSVFASDVKRARTWLERYAGLAAYGERDPELHYLRGLVDTRLAGHPEAAIRSLERMQALAPGFEPAARDTLYYEALLQWGAQLSRVKRTEEAVRQFRTAALVARRRGQPGRERAAKADAGIALSQASQFQEAGEVFQGLHQEEPDNPIWSYQLGLALASQFRYLEAIEAYKDSLAKQPGFQDRADVVAEIRRARLRLANCLKLQAGKVEPVKRGPILAESEKELLTYQKERPDDPLGHFYLGALLFDERDDYLGSVPHFRKAFELDPECEMTLRYLIRAYERAGGPSSEAGKPPTPEAVAAFKDQLAAWKKDLQDNEARRKKAIDQRTAETGDLSGGCS